MVLAQIENELHNPPGSAYVEWCGELAASLEFDVPWVMCNGASANNTVNTCNGNTCGEIPLRSYFLFYWETLVG